MDDVVGLRLNVWTSIVLFVLAAAYFVWAGRNRPGREESVYREAAVADPPEAAEAADRGDEAHEGETTP